MNFCPKTAIYERVWSRYLIPDARVQSHTGPYRIWAESSIGTYIPPSNSSYFPDKYHLTNSPYQFNKTSPMLYNLINWQSSSSYESMIFICPQRAVGLRTERPSVEIVPTGGNYQYLWFNYQWTLHKYSTSDHIIPNTLFRIILTSYVT